MAHLRRETDGSIRIAGTGDEIMLELAKETDFEEVNRLAWQVVSHHAQWTPDLEVVEHPYPMDYFLECIKPEFVRESTIYVMRQDERIVGYARICVWNTNSTVSARRTILNIDDIGVEESLRNLGMTLNL